MKRADGSVGIIDLMSSRTLPTDDETGMVHYLVVELKRPSKTIDPKVIEQTKSYARAVAKDPRFADTRVLRSASNFSRMRSASFTPRLNSYHAEPLSIRREAIDNFRPKP